MLQKRKYTRKSTVKRGRKPQQWVPIELSAEVPLQYAGEKCGWVWVRFGAKPDTQKPFTEWQELKNDTVNVKVMTPKFGIQFINFPKTDIYAFPQ